MSSQQAYRELIHGNDLTFGIGPAGTGKTFNAVVAARELLKKKSVKRLVLVRPAVEAGEKLGFLPGGMEDKLHPYLRPVFDAMEAVFGGVERVRDMQAKGVIEVAPVAFMRGRTLSDALVLVDEAQNMTAAQLKMLLTRFGHGSKFVVAGDVHQIDLRPSESGLRDSVSRLEGLAGVGVHRFSGEDVMRHPLVSAILSAYGE